MSSFNEEEFKRLLKKGIGLRTQKAFSEATGVAPITINRMLKGKNISRPKVETLRIFAKNMAGVSLKELLEACGYEYLDIEKTIDLFEKSIGGVAKSLTNERKIYRSLDALKLYFKDLDEKISEVQIKRNSEPCEIEYIDEMLKVVITWNYEDYICNTSFNLGCILTKGEYYLPFSSDIVNSSSRHTEYCNTKNAYKRISDFFDRFSGEVAYTTHLGYGFYIEDENIVPSGFLDFLIKHTSSFLYSRENTIMYQKALKKNADFFEIFKDFRDDYGSTGPYAVIAKIMENETKEIKKYGNCFSYLEKDSHYEEEKRKACIMCRFENDIPDDIDLDEDIVRYLRSCAKELGIPEFGYVYYPTVIYKENIVYKTDGPD